MAFFRQFIPVFRQKDWNLLLCGVRSRPPSSFEAIANHQGPDGCDWEFVLRTARRHGVSALLCRNLKKTPEYRVTEPVMGRLLAIFKENAGNCLSFIGGLLSILKAFQENGITAVPFKGPVLAQRVYGDPILRSFVDIDILVFPWEASKAVSHLSAAGYLPNVKMNDKQFSRYLKSEYSIEAQAKNGRVIVELHWELTGRYTRPPFLLETFADRLESIDLMGKRVHGMPAEELLVYLCVHGSKDGWATLESILSITELIDSAPGMDWDRVFRLCEKLQCTLMLQTGLFLAQDLFESWIPVDVVKRVQSDGTVRKIAERIYLCLFSEPTDAACRAIASDFSSFHFSAREKTSEKISYFLRLLFLPSRQEWRYFPVPASWHFLLFGVRPLRLFYEMGKQIISFNFKVMG